MPRVQNETRDETDHHVTSSTWAGGYRNKDQGWHSQLVHGLGARGSEFDYRISTSFLSVLLKQL